MCGIAGFIGEEPAAPVILGALKRLEYRGYDSAGMATISDGKLWLRKDVGKLDEVQRKHHLDKFPGMVGIGHVRWATHGGVTQHNAHPHINQSGNIAVVHNGIIENYQELRKRLEPRHTFISQTDTEVIPALIEEYMNDGAGLEEAVVRTIEELQGSYALLVISLNEPHKIIAARQDSPLVIGVADGRKFIASDALCFLEATNEAIFIEDGEIAVVTKDRVKFLNGDSTGLEKSPVKLDWKWDETSKQGYDFFTIKEIMGEPQSIRQALIQDKSQIQEMAMDILRARQVVITGSGTSRYAAIIGRYLFSKLAGKLCEVVMSSEFQYFSDSVDRNTLVIAVSQSGETADTLQGVKKAKQNGATVFSLVNVVGSSLSRMSDKVLYLNCGPEIGVAATKSFLSQLVLFYLLSFVSINRLEYGIESLRTASLAVEEALTKNSKGIEELACRIKNNHSCYYIARGINFAIAAEGALKLKEISYIHAEGMPAGELKHGTLALIEDGTPVVAICPQDYTFNETLANIAEAKARGAFIIGVSDQPDPIFNHWIEVPQVEEVFYPVVTIVPLQLLAYHLAVARGLDPDKPRNLAKSVTVK